ncbi:MAG: hypothetical protein AABW63_02150 [Nanoarchaeota archaeon]
MDKDIGKIQKNATTDILVRIDDFGGRKGVTIREFVTSDKYTGFTKAGTRVPAEHFLKFREMINSVPLSELDAPAESVKGEYKPKGAKPQKTLKPSEEELPDY